MRNLILTIALIAAGVGYPGQAHAGTSAADIIGYANMLAESRAGFVKWCKSGDFPGKVTKEKEGVLSVLRCTWLDDDDAFTVAVGRHPKRGAVVVAVGYHAKYFKAVQGELRKRYGYENVEITNADMDGWKVKLGGRNAVLTNVGGEGIGVLSVQYGTAK